MNWIPRVELSGTITPLRNNSDCSKDNKRPRHVPLTTEVRVLCHCLNNHSHWATREQSDSISSFSLNPFPEPSRTTFCNRTVTWASFLKAAVSFFLLTHHLLKARRWIKHWTLTVVSNHSPLWQHTTGQSRHSTCVAFRELGTYFDFF